jgi:hypothetical protein
MAISWAKLLKEDAVQRDGTMPLAALMCKMAQSISF